MDRLMVTHHAVLHEGMMQPHPHVVPNWSSPRSPRCSAWSHAGPQGLARVTVEGKSLLDGDPPQHHRTVRQSGARSDAGDAVVMPSSPVPVMVPFMAGVMLP